MGSSSTLPYPLLSLFSPLASDGSALFCRSVGPLLEKRSHPGRLPLSLDSLFCGKVPLCQIEGRQIGKGGRTPRRLGFNSRNGCRPGFSLLNRFSFSLLSRVTCLLRTDGHAAGRSRPCGSLKVDREGFFFSCFLR